MSFTSHRPIHPLASPGTPPMYASPSAGSFPHDSQQNVNLMARHRSVSNKALSQSRKGLSADVHGHRHCYPVANQYNLTSPNTKHPTQTRRSRGSQPQLPSLNHLLPQRISRNSFGNTTLPSSANASQLLPCNAVGAHYHLGEINHHVRPLNMEAIATLFPSRSLSPSTQHHAQSIRTLCPPPQLGNLVSVPYEAHILCSKGHVAQCPITLNAGAAALQGRRPTMEDTHSIHLNVGSRSAHGTSNVTLGLCMVLDGHCGRATADFACHTFPEKVFSHPHLGQDNVRVLIESLLQTDQLAFKTLVNECSGATHIASLVYNNMLFVIGLGDARAVLCENGSAIAMSRDHKASDSHERRRIMRAGGIVQFDRVGGCLAVSRALGDWEFKMIPGAYSYPSNPSEFVVSAIGEVFQINITDATEFLILACDGVWDVLPNDEAVSFVRKQLLKRKRHNSTPLSPQQNNTILSEIAVQLAQHAIDRHSGDNVSVIIQTFH